MFRFLNVQVCRGLFLLILTTIVFYTFTGSLKKIFEKSMEKIESSIGERIFNKILVSSRRKRIFLHGVNCGRISLSVGLALSGLLILKHLFSERPAVENIPQSGGDSQNGLSASVPRRGAPPPPPSDARDCTFDLPKNLIIYPIQDELQGLMLNLFYRIGLYEDAQFLLPKVQ